MPFKLNEIQYLINNTKLPFNEIIKKKIENKELTSDEEEKYQMIDKLLKRCVNVKRGTKLYLDPSIRQLRAHDLIAALADLEGGANMTRRLYNIAPGATIVAFMDGGNCLPPHIFRSTVREEDEYGNKTYKFILDIARLWKILKDNKNRFLQSPKKSTDDKNQNKYYNLFFGSLGSPTIENEDEAKDFLLGKNSEYPIPENLSVKICDGPREAIREAAKSIPIEWFEIPPKETKIDKSVKYGEELLSLTKQ